LRIQNNPSLKIKKDGKSDDCPALLHLSGVFLLIIKPAKQEVNAAIHVFCHFKRKALF